MKKPIIITMGDPAGIGPEIIIAALKAGALIAPDRETIIAGDITALNRSVALYGMTDAINTATGTIKYTDRNIQFTSLSELSPADIEYGKPTPRAGRATADYVTWACDQCIEGEAAAMVTAPLNKKIINEAGVNFPGHTELLAERCGIKKVVMMLAGTKLKVALVTTHCSYRQVPELLTSDEILQTIRITNRAMISDFGLKQPRLAVLSLNPHAGEGGLFGDEERTLIAPTIARAVAEGIDATGPHSADTLFHFAAQGDYDAVICMYHDQGLIPLKLLHFADGVNVTLGLPIIRTSVDHGTAYDLAGSGKADHRSLVAAFEMAVAMAESKY